MPYEFIGADYATTDHEAAETNYRRSAHACRELRPRWEVNAVQPEELQAAAHAYRVCRARLLDVQQYVGRAGGHPALPELPEGFPDLAATS